MSDGRVEGRPTAAAESASTTSPAASAPHPPARAEERSPDGRMARLHLRVGLLSLARAELETMAGDGTLDVAAMADLAEARWRTGDLPGAGEAALAHIGSGGRDVLAYVVAAEAYAAQGRTGDARRMAGEVLGKGHDLDALFAGEPQSAIWNGTGASVGAAPGGLGRKVKPVGLGPRDGEAGAASPPAPETARHTPAEVSPAIGAARLALRARDPAGVASRLAVALRADLADVAQDVLEIADSALADAGRLDAAALQLIRGDALTLLDRPNEAADAYRASNQALGGPGREESQ